MGLKVLMILSDHGYPPDIRLDKEIGTLCKKGVSVTVLAQGVATERREEDLRECRVVRFTRPMANTPKIGGAFYLGLFRYLLFFTVIRTRRRLKPDILHVHDLPYVFPTVLVGKLTGTPVIVDLHENYPDMIMTVHGSSVMTRAICRLLEYDERHVLDMADHMIVVVDEQLERYREMGIDTDISVVSNFPSKDEMTPLDLDRTPFEGRYICYVGGFEPFRGLDTTVRAFSAVANRHRDVSLVLVGGQESEVSTLRKGLKELENSDRIKLVGKQPFETAMQYVAHSEICLVPHKRAGVTEYTIPHKLFQYMYFRKPVIVTDLRPLKRIVEDAGCGLCFRSDDHDDLAEKMDRLLSNPGLCRRMGSAGHKAVTTKYNWEAEGRKLIEIYKKMGS